MNPTTKPTDENWEDKFDRMDMEYPHSFDAFSVTDWKNYIRKERTQAYTEGVKDSLEAIPDIIDMSQEHLNNPSFRARAEGANISRNKIYAAIKALIP